jgi:hypothetical protein
MAGRIAYLMVAGSAIVGGMYFQGDLDFDGDRDRRSVTVHESRDRDIDRRIDRIVDRETRRASRGGETVDAATKRALAEAVAELVRAEGSLVAIKLDGNIPAEAIKQAEHRRNLARQAVDRISDEVKVQSRGDRDELRQTIRDEVRAAVRGG